VRFLQLLGISVIKPLAAASVPAAGGANPASVSLTDATIRSVAGESSVAIGAFAAGL